MQYLGRSTLTGKSTTTLRQGGTRTLDNKQSEVYSYLYSGVLKSKDYYDLPYGIRRDYSDYYDKEDLYSYVGEESGNTNTVIATMKSRNMLASLLTAETFTFIPNMVRLTGSKIDYGDFNGSILPSMIYESNGDLYEQSIEVKSYDSHGNPTEILDKKTGIYSVFLWDTYDRYLIAMIKDARLSQIPNITQLRAATSQVRRSMLLTTFPNALIQTWNYLPLVGVSSHTDVNGQTFLYEYDGLGRLKSEKRVVNGVQAPEILHRYEYNYMNQQ
jgi:YD repeat-containing protein